jgi:hypothetical protein
MGLTKPRAAQIFNLDYKQSTRVVTVSNVTLSGGAPTVVDGVTLVKGDRVLVTAQTTGSENGLYLVSTLGTGSNGTWSRTSDGNENGEIEAGMIVMVTEGTIYADTQWKLITDDPIVIGTTPLTFTQNYSANSISGGTSNVVVLTNSAVTISSAGTANVLAIGSNTVTVTANLNPIANVTYSLGNTTNRWQDLWLSNSTIYLGNVTLGATAQGLTVDGNSVLTGGSGGNTLSVTGNITGGNILTDGAVSAIGNVTGNYILGNGVSLTGVITSVANINLGTSNVTVVSSGGNVTVGIGGTGNIAVFSTGGLDVAGRVSTTGNVTGGNVNTAGLVSATGGVTAASVVGGVITGTSTSVTGTQTAASTVGGIITGTSVSASGGVTAASVAGGVITGTSTSVTGGVTAASVAGGVITGTSTSVTGTQTAASTVGGVITGTSASVSGTVTAASTVGGVITGTSASVTGNVTGANLVVSTNIYDATAMTLVTGAGDINLQPAGNVVVNSKNINGLAQPVQNQDAATKLYVDNAVSTAISYHQPVVAATTTTLATTTGGTVTYSQPNGAANGVGALLTTTGSFNLIDTANVQTVGTRILVKNEANAVFNGVYTWANATNIVRATDADIYGSGNTLALGLNDYFFVSSGNVNLGSAYIVSAPTGTITFGTSNIAFAQFSQSQVYTANTQAGINLVGTVINAKVDNATTAFDGGGNISVKAGANLTTPNIGAATGTSLSVTGAVTAASTVGGVITGSSASLSGNVSGGNLNVTGNIVDSGALSIITGSNGNIALAPNGTGIVTASGNISAVGNITANYLFGNGSQLTGISAGSGGNLWVVTRLSGTIYVPILSGSLNVVARTGNISVPINS